VGSITTRRCGWNNESSTKAEALAQAYPVGPYWPLGRPSSTSRKQEFS